MNLRNVKLVVWHKTEKAKYNVLSIDWNTGSISLVKRMEDDTDAIEKIPFESIDSVVLIEVRFNDY